MNSMNRFSLIAVVVIAIVVAAALALGTGSADAQLGNSGIPVRCFKPGPAMAPGTAEFLTCVASDGTLLPEGQRVPAGHYLLITDVLITPDAGTATTGLNDITVFDAYGTNSRQSSFRLRSVLPNSFGVAFNTPYFVLAEGHRLEISSAAFSAHSVEIRVSGLLVTNLSYLPIVQQ